MLTRRSARALVEALAGALVGVLVTSSSFAAQQRAPQTPGLTVERIFRTGEFQLAPLPETHWLRDRESFIDVRASSDGAGSAIIRTDAVTGKTTVLVPASALVGTDGRPLDVEDMTLADDETKALLFHHSERVWRVPGVRHRR